ncbi:MAG: hypothetical protein JO035_10970 [Betaproteobacteria bacterium]|nr:hypothetical protein [Betaproteobacteria bacterium]
MRGLRLVALLASVAGAIGVAAYSATEGDPASASAKLPDNRRDPEDRAAQKKEKPESASTGSSATDVRRPEPVTDIGKEADREDEALRRRESSKKP